VFERRICEPEGEEVTEGGEYVIKGRFIICSVHQMVLG
jgi:hypothetical protein